MNYLFANETKGRESARGGGCRERGEGADVVLYSLLFEVGKRDWKGEKTLRKYREKMSIIVYLIAERHWFVQVKRGVGRGGGSGLFCILRKTNIYLNIRKHRFTVLAGFFLYTRVRCWTDFVI